MQEEHFPGNSPRRYARLLLAVLTATGLLSCHTTVFSQDKPKPVEFDRDIRPILAANCYMCHGPDEKMRMMGLRFDTRDGAFAVPGVIVPGNARNSELIMRVTSSDDVKHMPLRKSGRSLTEQQIDLLRRWIDEGAKWETHWSFVPPRRPEIPKASQSTWPRNPIDNFVLARLDKESLQPSPGADKVTLLRRVTFDLTGLPPTLAEIDSFLADKSPDAYERRVDLLLASPHYGERMAMPWLDLARYADTHGYHIDSEREMWHWRDWVIDAFNRNIPFDEFTVEQLAGDLLTNASVDQKIASGFNRNHMINFEGGAIPEEYQVEYVVDRVEATSSTWLGLTMGCARCHDHKFDPITQKEFYQFYAFFNTVPEEGLDGKTGNAKPLLPLPSHEQKAGLDRLNALVKELESRLTDKEVAPLQEAWEKPYTTKLAESPRSGLLAHYELDGNLSDVSGSYRHGRTIRGDPTFNAGRVGNAVGFDGETQVEFDNMGNFDRADPFTLTFWLRGGGNTPMAVLQKVEDGPARRGYEVVLDDLSLIGIQRRAARLGVQLESRWPADAIAVRTTQRLALGEWHHIAIRYDGSGKAAGLTIFLNGKPLETEVLQDNLSGSFKTASALGVGDKKFGTAFRGNLDDLRVYGRALDPGDIEQLAIRYPIEAILSGVTGKRTKEESARVREYFLTYAAPEEMRRCHTELKELERQRADLEKTIPTTMVMSEMEKQRETFVLARGDYRSRTDKVEPDVPSVLPPLPAGTPRNRLTLARWLVNPANPLTAKVAVNRFWQMYFGVGVVKTLEDFGSQGEPPSHPELLDWLATEFIRTGWDVKAMQRLIVTSSTYRQSSKATPELLERDPDNRLLARGPRFRLPAEMVRDTALAASGLLTDRIGGPGVYPYQPKGVWEELAFGDGFSAQSYTQSKGKDLYRRSLYTFVKRTAPNPSMAVFDMPDREKCLARRAVTNTPLQALVLLNDPTYVEAARALAERAIAEGGGSASRRIAYTFRSASARVPSTQELRALDSLYRRELEHYRRDPKAALDLLRVGNGGEKFRSGNAELAALTTVASAILNLDETITRQ